MGQAGKAAKGSGNVVVIAVSVIVTAVIVGGGVYLWQKSNFESTEQRLQEKITLQQQTIENLESEQLQALVSRSDDDDLEADEQISTDEAEIDSEEETQDDESEKNPYYTSSAPCSDPPVFTEIGRYDYPREIKYAHLNFLGQLFTAFNCGPARVSKIFGVEGNVYTLGSVVFLKDIPSQLLLDVFEEVGFICADGEGETCQRWELGESVSLDKLIKLEPYSELFSADDCINCG